MDTPKENRTVVPDDRNDRFARVGAEGMPVGEPPAPTSRRIQKRSDEVMVCCVPGCGRPRGPRRDPFCRAHRKRKERGADLEAPIRPYGTGLAKRLEDATHAYFAAESDLEFERARARMRMVLRDAKREGMAAARALDGTTKHVEAALDTGAEKES